MPKKNNKKNNKMLYVIIGIVILILLTQGKKEVNGGDVSVEPTVEEAITTLPTCSNLCSRYGLSGSYETTGICRAGELRLSYGYPNQVPLLICCCYDVAAAPDNDGDGIPDATDPDDDNDGYTDDEEIGEGTDPNDPTDYPGADEGVIIYTCGQNGDIYCQGTCPPTHPECAELYFATGNYYACVCIDGETVHTDWKPGGSYHNPGEELIDEPPDEEISYNCYDNDVGMGFPDKLTVKGYCTDDFDTYWDYCNNGMIRDWYCIWEGTSYECTDATSQNCAVFVPGSTCVNGACYKPPTEEEICADRCPNHSAPLSVTGTGWGCMNYADSWCVTNRPPEGYSTASSDNLCCCWSCQMD